MTKRVLSVPDAFDTRRNEYQTELHQAELLCRLGKVNEKQYNVCAIAAFVLLFRVGMASLQAMPLGWRAAFGKPLFVLIIVIVCVACFAFILARDKN